MLLDERQKAHERLAPQDGPESGSKAVLLVSCPADSGLVTQLVGFIHSHGGIISHVDHHLDHETSLSFSRIGWDLARFSLAPGETEAALREVACCIRATWRLSFSHRRARIALMVSRQDHCLLDLLLRQRDGEIEADISVVISNHRDLQPLVEQFGVPYHCFPITRENQLAQERRQLAVLREHKIEFVVLARYMRILGADFVNQFPQRIINIHHAFLPAFPAPARISGRTREA